MALAIEPDQMPKGAKSQKMDFKSGNEMAALSACQIDYHVMGYYPITPSTEIAEYLDEMRAAGLHNISMVPADGEHGAAGICYGASVGGGRVFNATSANGLLYAIEQLPVQSGTRFPMVLALACRSVSGPLDIRGDHSDLYYTLNTGWLVLTARDPQAVYDMHFVALKLAEHPDVRLPAVLAFDGFFTSHQKRRVEYFVDKSIVQEFIGENKPVYTALNPREPMTFGPYMNDPDMINNKVQLTQAMEAAYKALPGILAEYAAISGREYPLVDCYQMDDAEVALFLVNSAAETAKDVVDQLRAKGIKAGVVSPNVLRPFPINEIKAALKNVKSLVIGERADSYGAQGGPLSHEVKSALQSIPGNSTLCQTRIYGLGGKDFFSDDAEAFFQLAIEAAESGEVKVAFDYHGGNPGDPAQTPKRVIAPLTKEETSGFVTATLNEETGKIDVKVPPLRALTKKPDRIAPGHGACPGCGIFPGLNNFLKGIDGDVVLLFHTGCAMVVTTGYPFSAHRVTYVHNLFQNGAATLSGLVEMFHELQRRGEIPASEDITFIMVTGDGGMDIGMGPAIGTALRNHKMIILEYDNEGYMNTGSQLSYSTPLGHMTTTSHVGKQSQGKTFHHKDTAQIMAATNIPYVFTGSECNAMDLVKKAAKAQWYAKNEGLAYGKILITCPLNWKSQEKIGRNILQAAVDSCFFPLYEIEHGVTTLTYNPEARNKRVDVTEWLKMMGKTKHLLKKDNEALIKLFADEVERRWARLKAMHEHPLL